MQEIGLKGRHHIPLMAKTCKNKGQFLTYFTKLFVEEVTYNIRFLTERGNNVWWFDGERVNFSTEYRHHPTTSRPVPKSMINPSI